jgi:hypothetical protein
MGGGGETSQKQPLSPFWFWGLSQNDVSD